MQEEPTYHPILEQLRQQQAFAVPKDYFEQMHAQIAEKVELLQEAPVLFSEDVKNTFAIPELFFENFAATVEEAIQFENAGDEQISPVLNSLNANAFATPQNYFEKLNSSILNSIEETELKQQAPLLFSMQAQQSFEVPEGYLANFASQVQFAIRKQEQKGSSLVSQLLNLLKPQYSISFALGCFVIWLGLNFNSAAQKISDADLFAQINPKEASDYLNNNIASQLDDAMLIDAVDGSKLKSTIDKETEDYLLNNIDVSTLEDAL